MWRGIAKACPCVVRVVRRRIRNAPTPSKARPELQDDDSKALQGGAAELPSALPT